MHVISEKIKNNAENALEILQEAMKAVNAGLFENAWELVEKAESWIQTGKELVNTAVENHGSDIATVEFVNACQTLTQSENQLTIVMEFFNLYRKLNKDFLHFG